MIKITPNPLKGEIKIVSSKSLSHRYLIGAALANGVSVIDNVLDSKDLTATKESLTSLGIKIEGNTVYGGTLKVINNIIDANESGSTLRFLIPISMLLEKEVTFIGKGLLPERPLNVYEDIFKDKYLYKKTTKNSLPLTVKGPLLPGDYVIPGNVSSQFVTGLLFSLPLLNGNSKIIIEGNLESRSYVNLTLDTLKDYQVKIIEKDNEFIIPGNQKYIPLKKSVPGDYSGAAFFIGAGLIGEKLILKNLLENSLQGDAKMIDIVKSMGGNIYFQNNDLIVEPSTLTGVTVDMEDYPDLGPILMALGAVSKGKMTLTNAKRLRIKESDRISAMVSNLNKLGVKTYELEDEVTVYGNEKLKGDVLLNTFNDHRIAMALAILSIKCELPITLDDETVVAKSYPTFFKEFVRLGGIIDE